ncbi:hypothetical protein [Bryobacter aggregatus]|uniref:hypothetical protein n=1 Tax=Bryobacter aggregatus TaxID=360054 RepID=UPI0004E100AA|nr:hypothetical protein [Bryobacter aggregatus]
MVDNNKLTLLGGRDFMRLHPVVALHYGGGGVPRTIKGNGATGLASVDSACRILWANVNPVINYMGLNLAHTTMSRKAVSLTLSTVAPGVPIFHLPYNNDQNFRVTLVDRQGVGNVNFFITEFVDGCSVYIEGSRTAPTAYHINAVSTQRRTSWKQFYWSDARKRRADWRAKYAKMDHRFKTEGNIAKSVMNALPGTLPPPTKIENHDYMGDLGLNLAALQHANRAPTVMMGQSVDGFELMAQQGTIFGERNIGSGEWKFYVQRRALLRYLHIDIHGVPTQLGFQWMVVNVEQFWPTAKTGRIVV